MFSMTSRAGQTTCHHMCREVIVTHACRESPATALLERVQLYAASPMRSSLSSAEGMYWLAF